MVTTSVRHYLRHKLRQIRWWSATVETQRLRINVHCCTSLSGTASTPFLLLTQLLEFPHFQFVDEVFRVWGGPFPFQVVIVRPIYLLFIYLFIIKSRT